MSNTVYEHEWREMRKGIAEIKRRAQVSKGIHGIIRKVPKTHRYVFTKKGWEIATTTPPGCAR